MAVVTIMLINYSLFLVVLKSVIAASKSNGLRSTQSSQLKTWYQFRMAICLFFLLGLTWIFGFLSISDARTVFFYHFASLALCKGSSFLCFLFCAKRMLEDCGASLLGVKIVSLVVGLLITVTGVVTFCNAVTIFSDGTVTALSFKNQ